MTVSRYTSLLYTLLLLTACDKFRSSHEDNSLEVRGFKGAVKDFWHFSTGSSIDTRTLNGAKPQKDVWSIQDKSSRTRARALVDVDASLELPLKRIRDKGFRLARHLMLDTKAAVVLIRFWSRGFRLEGGVFAQLVLSQDGKDWQGRATNEDKYFRYLPKGAPWKKLTKDERRILTVFSTMHRRAAAQGVLAPRDTALRETAAKTNLSPAQIQSLLKKSRRLFYHPR